MIEPMPVDPLIQHDTPREQVVQPISYVGDSKEYAHAERSTRIILQRGMPQLLITNQEEAPILSVEATFVDVSAQAGQSKAVESSTLSTFHAEEESKETREPSSTINTGVLIDNAGTLVDPQSSSTDTDEFELLADPFLHVDRLKPSASSRRQSTAGRRTIDAPQHYFSDQRAFS